MVEAVKWIVSISISLLGLIIGLAKAKGKNRVVAISQKLVALAKIVQKIPDYIIEAERILGQGHGTDKLALVLKNCKLDCQLAGVNFIEAEFVAEIEKILSTPEKKVYEENANEQESR